MSELAAASADPQDLGDEPERVLRGVGHCDDSMTPVLQLKGVGKLLRSAHPTRVTISIAERDSHTPLTIVARGNG